MRMSIREYPCGCLLTEEFGALMRCASRRCSALRNPTVYTLKTADVAPPRLIEEVIDHAL